MCLCEGVFVHVHAHNYILRLEVGYTSTEELIAPAVRAGDRKALHHMLRCPSSFWRAHSPSWYQK